MYFYGGQMNEWGSLKVHSTVDEKHKKQKEPLGICGLELVKTFTEYISARKCNFGKIEMFGQNMLILRKCSIQTKDAI